MCVPPASAAALRWCCAACRSAARRAGGSAWAQQADVLSPATKAACSAAPKRPSHPPTSPALLLSSLLSIHCLQGGEPPARAAGGFSGAARSHRRHAARPPAAAAGGESRFSQLLRLRLLLHATGVAVKIRAGGPPSLVAHSCVIYTWLMCDPRSVAPSCPQASFPYIGIADLRAIPLAVLDRLQVGACTARVLPFPRRNRRMWLQPKGLSRGLAWRGIKPHVLPAHLPLVAAAGARHLPQAAGHGPRAVLGPARGRAAPGASPAVLNYRLPLVLAMWPVGVQRQVRARLRCVVACLWCLQFGIPARGRAAPGATSAVLRRRLPVVLAMWHTCPWPWSAGASLPNGSLLWFYLVCQPRRLSRA